MKIFLKQIGLYSHRKWPSNLLLIAELKKHLTSNRGFKTHLFIITSFFIEQERFIDYHNKGLSRGVSRELFQYGRETGF